VVCYNYLFIACYFLEERLARTPTVVSLRPRYVHTHVYRLVLRQL
jgi:hypothetical protein